MTRDDLQWMITGNPPVMFRSASGPMHIIDLPALAAIAQAALSLIEAESTAEASASIDRIRATAQKTGLL